MITGILLGVLISIGAALAWRILRSASAKARNIAIGAFLGLWTVGVIVKVYLDRETDDFSDPLSVARSVQAMSWTDELSIAEPSDSGQDSASTPNASAADSVMDAAPVPTLLSGLEARLAEHPNDADGWALLAQSYAFVGDIEKAEEAVTRAVALGVDEQVLRERVTFAKREPHPSGNWIEQTIGAERR